MTPYAMDARHESTKFNVCLMGFSIGLFPFLLSITPISPFWNGNASLCLCMLEVYNLLFEFYGGKGT
jgi:hypothetical protein